MSLSPTIITFVLTIIILTIIGILLFLQITVPDYLPTVLFGLITLLAGVQIPNGRTNKDT